MLTQRAPTAGALSVIRGIERMTMPKTIKSDANTISMRTQLTRLT